MKVWRRSHSRGVMAAGLWKENDRIEEFNQILQMEIILAKSVFFLGTWGDFCVFRESVLARRFMSFFVLWIIRFTCKLLRFLSLNSFGVHRPFGNLILFLDGVCGSECIFVEKVLQWVTLGQTAEKRWKQITIQTCRIEWVGWWREDLTWVGTSDNLDMRNCQFTTQVVQHSCSETPAGLLSTTLQALAEAFRVNKTIKIVDLRFNQIGDEGVKAQPQPRGDGCGLWKENDRIEEFNQLLQMEIILAKSVFFLGTWGDFCVFRESVLARTFMSFFVLWIFRFTCKHLRFLSLNSFGVHRPFGNLILFLDGVCGSECIFVEKVLQWVTLGQTAEKRWKQITIQTCRIEWVGWWREDLTWVGTSDNLDMRNCQFTMQVVQHSCSETPTGLLSTTLQALAEAFRVNKTIILVDLSFNQIGDEGVKAQPQPRGDGCGAVEGEWQDRGIQSNTADAHHFRKVCFFLGTWDDFCVFRESVLARTFRSFFVLWIGGSTDKLLSPNSFEVHCPIGNLILFLDGVCGFSTYFSCWKKAEANHYANM